MVDDVAVTEYECWWKCWKDPTWEPPDSIRNTDIFADFEAERLAQHTETRAKLNAEKRNASKGRKTQKNKSGSVKRNESGNEKKSESGSESGKKSTLSYYAEYEEQKIQAALNVQGKRNRRP